MMILMILLGLATLICAIQAIRTNRLLISAIWLAGASALTALIMYILGAFQVAVIELSVGAGLVTILFVYAFSIIGELTIDERGIVPRPLVWTLVAVFVLTLSWLTLPHLEAHVATGEASFASVLWQQRGLDIIVQIILIFSGILGLTGLLTHSKKSPATENAKLQTPNQSQSDKPGAV